MNKYKGKEKLLVDNGKMLHIAHVGNGQVPTMNNRPLTLNELLHVPSIKKNLVGVSQLTYDNSVFIEFYSNCCVVKDLQMKRILLQRVLKEGLYQLQLPNHKLENTTLDSNHQNNVHYFINLAVINHLQLNKC